jgi:hypothetical protein
MPNKGVRFSSDYLPKEQMHSALLALPGVLQTLLGEHRIVASHGWAANIHSDLRYHPMNESTHRIQYFIEDSIKQRIIIPGESDFRFEVPNGRLDLVFCHESDIHLDGSDDELLRRFMASEPFCKMQWHTKEDVEKMMR